MEPLLSLSPDQFRAALAELQLDPQREADLVRQYRRANSPLAPIYGLLDRVAAGDVGEGMQRASMLPLARPEGMSVAEAVRSGDARLAVPQGVLDAISGLLGGIDAPAAAARGLLPAQNMTSEAMGTAGVAMGAGGLLSRPAGSVGMGGRVARDFDVSRRDASNIFGEGSERVRYTDPQSGGTMEVVVRPNGQASVLELEVPEEFRGQGIGQLLQARVMQDFPVMGGQVSSKAAATTAYRLGRRPYGQPDATLEDVFRMIDEDSSVNLISPAAQPTDLSANRSTTTGLLASAASDTPAQQVARLLREGRADEVTDDLMAQADPQEMFRLYVTGETGMDLPMDFASRMARAAEMGFDLESYLRHGSKRDFPGFQIGAEQSTDYGWYGQGVSLAPNDPSISDAYAMVEKEGMGQWGGRVYPVTSRGRMYEWPEENPPALSRDQSIEITQSLRDLGYEGANVYAPNDFDTWGDAAGSWRERVIYDPRNIRSRFARFDPRLSHLANLNAANISPLAGLLAIMQAQEPRQ